MKTLTLNKSSNYFKPFLRLWLSCFYSQACILTKLIIFTFSTAIEKINHTRKWLLHVYVFLYISAMWWAAHRGHVRLPSSLVPDCLRASR